MLQVGQADSRDSPPRAVTPKNRNGRGSRNRPRDTLIWKLAAVLKYRVMQKGRYAPPVHMIRLTQKREIAPHAWVHPDDDDRR